MVLWEPSAEKLHLAVLRDYVLENMARLPGAVLRGLVCCCGQAERLFEMLK